MEENKKDLFNIVLWEFSMKGINLFQVFGQKLYDKEHFMGRISSVGYLCYDEEEKRIFPKTVAVDLSVLTPYQIISKLRTDKDFVCPFLIPYIDIDEIVAVLRKNGIEVDVVEV